MTAPRLEPGLAPGGLVAVVMVGEEIVAEEALDDLLESVEEIATRHAELARPEDARVLLYDGDTGAYAGQLMQVTEDGMAPAEWGLWVALRDVGYVERLAPLEVEGVPDG